MSTHNEVAHAWANQTGKNRKGHHMFYEGDTIYSYGYHFPIARRILTSEGIVVLMTTRKYSVSTAKHITYTWRASHHLKMFHVPMVRDNPNSAFNVQDYISRIVDSLEKAKRARVYAQHYLDQAQALIEEVKDYIRIFEVPGYEHMVWEPDAIVAGAREAAARQYAREQEAIAKRQAEAKRRYREEVWPWVKNWLRGSTIGTQGRLHTTRPLPRIEGDKVVTTWGASVPLTTAKRLYWLAVQCRRQHKGYVPHDTMMVGDFALRHIKKNGDIVVGCHDIPFWFMRYAACRAGIPAEQPKAIALV
ncbi:MAG: hypothetical protein EOQ89_03630 [Mesorhizobium sp.]|nr:MAG: hypothetical protein EOQ89_03630 [Mesorhizobium sp.]